MKTIAFNIQKGGVGKTSLSVSTAAELAWQNKNVLLIDADPQASASGWIGPQELTYELADVLNGKTTLKEAIVKTSIPGLFLLPSAGLAGELSLFSKTLASQEDRCFKKLAREAAVLGYNYIVIDTNPAFDPLTWCVFMGTDEVITPLLPDSFAADWLTVFSENLKKFRESKETEKPFFKRFIVNAVDRRIPQHLETLTRIQAADNGLTVYTYRHRRPGCNSRHHIRN